MPSDLPGILAEMDVVAVRPCQQPAGRAPAAEPDPPHRGARVAAALDVLVLAIPALTAGLRRRDLVTSRR
jgi:hypothetical protein